MGQEGEYASSSEKKVLKSILGLRAQTPSPLTEALGAVSPPAPSTVTAPRWALVVVHR